MITLDSRSATAWPHSLMKMKDRKYIADHLLLTADLLELLTGDPAEPELYRNGASYLRQSPELLAKVPSMEDLAPLAEISNDVFLDAETLLHTGDTELLLRLRERIPIEVREMLALPGLGPKRLREIWKRMGIGNLAALSHAASENRLLHAKGFGPKTQEKVIASIAAANKNRNLFSLSELRPIAMTLELELRALLGPSARFDLTGEYRRGCTVCSAIEVIAEPDHYKSILLHLVQNDHYEIMTAGQDFVLGRVRDTAIPLRFHFRGFNYYLELFRTTGNSDHVAAISIDECKQYRSEAEIYAGAGLPYFPAALREGLDEIQLAKKKGLPKLVHHTDIRGLMHAHSRYSDGSDSLEDMAVHCRDLQMEYLGISDHGPHHGGGRGMRLDAIKLQHKEIDRLNHQLAPFRILKGIELDILEDGSFGMHDLELANFDFVIASLHEDQNLTVAEATIRLIRAIRNPFVSILGHATGRLLFGSAGHAVNIEAVIDACVANEVAIEINCHRDRMDLDWEAVRMAVSKSANISINPNAHSALALNDFHNGIAVARKGMLTPALTFNARSLVQIEEFLLQRRRLRIG